MGKIIYSILCGVVIIGVSHADPLKTVTSQKYVEDTLGDKQTAFVAKDGDKVVTYTGSAGTAGERDVIMDSADVTTGNTGIMTVNALDTGGKQDVVLNIPATNVITATNVYGDISSRHIYDTQTNKFVDGLVDAGTVNAAIISAVNNEFTEVSAGFLINDAPMATLQTTLNLRTKDNSIGSCYKRQDNGQTGNEGGTANQCTTAQLNGLGRGEWITRFADFDVRGASVCSNITPPDSMKYDQSPEGDPYYHSGYIASDSNDISTLESQWTSQTGGGTLASDEYHCWCKLTSPAASSWVFDYSSDDSAGCALNCANFCAGSVRSNARFRGAVFGSVAQ